MRANRIWELAGLVCVVLLALPVSIWAGDQGSRWKDYNDAGFKAYLQGDYAEAEKQFMDAIKEGEGFGPEDNRLAASLNNLAGLYRAQVKYAEAEPLYRRSLAIGEKVLGPDHPDVATSLNNLAELYDAQGKYTEAEPLYRRSLAIGEKALGPDHPDVATVLENYAALLRKMQHTTEAEKMEARAKSIRAKHVQ